MIRSALQKRSKIVFGLVLFLSLATPQVLTYAQTNSNNYSDSKPGSVLFFNRFSSNPVNPAQGDTQISITNFNQSAPISLHFFLVDGGTCSVANFGTSLTQSQTTSFLMSDYDPGVFGYLIVVAESMTTGRPTNFNWLGGVAHIRENDGRIGALSAISIAKVSAGDITPDPATSDFKLRFNGSDYDRLPTVLAVTSFDSQVSVSSFLYIYSPPTDLYFGESGNTVNIFCLIFNDTEQSRSSSFSLSCYRQDSLTNIFNRSGGINQHVPPGRSGWIRLSGSGSAILGSLITRSSRFGGGYNLHAITLLGSHEIRVPVF
jgi:hypothetical protein